MAISLIFFSTLSTVLYRIGGTQLGTKYRDWGVPTCMIWFFISQGIKHWSLVLCWLLMFFAQTTYNKWAHKFFLKDKSNDVKWIDWFFTGLAYSFCMLPYALAIGNVHGFILRGVVVTVFVTLWSEFIGNATIEEMGRGAVQVGTLPLLIF
jgi:hypothetical protein